MENKDSYEFFEQIIREMLNLISEHASAMEELRELQADIESAENFRDDLLDRYGDRYGDVSVTEAGRYSREELETIREELADQSMKDLLLRVTGFRRTREDDYLDAMVKIKSLLVYLQGEWEACSGRAEAQIERLRMRATEYEQYAAASRKRHGFAVDSNWDEYVPVQEMSGDLYLCDADYHINIPEINKKAIMATLQDCMPTMFTGNAVRVPYTHSLTEPVRFRYEYTKENAAQAVQAARAVIYQMIRLMPDDYIQLHLMDGMKKGQYFTDLIPLEEVRKSDVIELNRKVTGGNYRMAELYLDDAQITEGLKKLDQHMTNVAREVSADGGTLEAYNQINAGTENGKGLIPYQLVIIQNFPNGFNDDDIRLLEGLIGNGRSRGVSVLLLNDIDSWSELAQQSSYGREKIPSIEDKIRSDILDVMETFNIDSDGVEFSVMGASGKARSFPSCHLQLMETGKRNYIQSIIKTKMTIKKVDNSFETLFSLDRPFGGRNATESLRIPFALDKRGRLMEYCLGEAMNAHGLISGGTGSGKSTLLHMLITSVAIHYSPDDVEIWLTDYKITEFATYKTNTPPHVRFIGLSKTVDFSYAFIDKITDEMNRRQNLIAMADFELKQKGGEENITNFREYREKFGVSSMRRLLIIIDEFHVMAQHAQLEPEYKQKLENLLAEARALGIIMLFSDQAIVDGLRGLSDKGKKQIKARIAMSNYEDELKETLNERERDKIKPFLNMKVGECAVQSVTEERDEDGAPVEVTHIERGQVVYINGSWRFKTNAKVREAYHAQDYVPDYFDDREIESVNWKEIDRWEEESLPAHRNGEKDLQVYVGRPLNLQFSMHFPLLQRKGNNIMSVAGSEEQQMRIIQSVIASFSRQRDYEVVILTDPYAGVYREFGPEMEMMAQRDDRIKVYDSLEDVCYQTNRLLARVNDRGNQKKTLILWLGLDSMADLFNEESTRKPDALKKLTNEDDSPVKKPETNSLVQETQKNLDDAFAMLFGGFDLPKEEPTKEASLSEESGEASYLYNACEDITRIIHLGPVRNVYNMVVYDSAVSLRDFRGVKITDFNHRIAFVMGDNEASDFLERSNLIRSMQENQAFYFNGRAGAKFVPYKL